MNRQQKLRRKARIWQVVGVLTFLVGFVLVWERVSYNLHDFYSENFDVAEVQDLADYHLSTEQENLLSSAIGKMQQKHFWDATTDLDNMKELGGPGRQVAEWYKALCMIALEEKESAISLLTYYCEQPDFSFKIEEARDLLEMY